MEREMEKGRDGEREKDRQRERERGMERGRDGERDGERGEDEEFECQMQRVVRLPNPSPRAGNTGGVCVSIMVPPHHVQGA